MSTYELEDHEVEMILTDLRGHDSEMAKEIADRIEAQIPIPAPTKIGAVVRATHNSGGVFTRWGTDEQVDRPWVDSTDGEHVQTERLGRITEVRSEGVDL